MIEIIFLTVLAFLWLAFASVNDLRERIVPNWLSFSFIIFALGFRVFYSLFSSDFSFLIQGLIGFGIFFALGNALYYGRMFAGGDANLMIALGAILPLSGNFSDNLNIFVSFFFIFLISSAVYGMGWSIALSLGDLKNFREALEKQFQESKKNFYIILSLGILISLAGFFITPFFYLGLVFFLSAYLFVYAKTVDNFCLAKTISTGELTEGDWLYRNLKIGNKIIKARWEGLSKSEIAIIRKKLKSVKIKQGIPFVPVFLISFAILIWLYFSGINLTSFF